MNREINTADAFVAAWLPGSEGAGIADVLLRKADGSVQNDFKGKLSFSWPRTAVQFHNNVGQKDYDPQFAFGYGLTYADKGEQAKLSEDSGVSGDQSAGGVYFNRGKPAIGLAMQLSSATQTDMPATTVPVGLSDGSLKMSAVDHKAQEDARRLVWSGATEARVQLVSGKAVDLSRETNGDIVMYVTLRRDADVAAPLWLGVGCGQGCAGQVDIGKTVGKLPAGEWKVIGVPLKCFQVAGADMTKLVQLPYVASAAKADVSFSRIALGQSQADAVAVDCATTK
jgi:beta-glucosidase